MADNQMADVDGSTQYSSQQRNVTSSNLMGNSMVMN